MNVSEVIKLVQIGNYTEQGPRDVFVEREAAAALKPELDADTFIWERRQVGKTLCSSHIGKTPLEVHVF